MIQIENQFVPTEENLLLNMIFTLILTLIIGFAALAFYEGGKYEATATIVIVCVFLYIFILISGLLNTEVEGRKLKGGDRDLTKQL